MTERSLGSKSARKEAGAAPKLVDGVIEWGLEARRLFVTPATTGEMEMIVSNDATGTQAKSGKALLTTIVSCCLLFLGYIWREAPMTYPGFIHHNKSYFKQVAEECERLRSQSNSGMSKRRIEGNDPSLPLIIRRMRPEYLSIGTNYVSIVVDSGNLGWGVLWEQCADKSWDLSACGEDLRTPVFSTNLPPK